jgi:hypothetical protein
MNNDFRSLYYIKGAGGSIERKYEKIDELFGEK